MGFVFSAPKNQHGDECLLHVLKGHRAGINCMAINDEGTILVTGSEDTTAILWSTSLDDPGCYGELVGHTERINCVAFEDKYVFSGSADTTIRKWHCESLDCLLVIQGHTSIIQRIICAGDFIFSSSYDHTARCWDFDSGEPLRVFRGHTRGVYPLLFRPGDEKFQQEYDEDPDILVTGSADNTAISWDISTGKPLNVFGGKYGHTEQITCLALDGPGDILFTGSIDYTVRTWYLHDGGQHRVFKGHEGVITCIQVVGSTLYTGSADCTTRKWNVHKGREMGRYDGETTRSLSSLKVIRYGDEKFVITASGDDSIRCFEDEGCKLIKEVAHDGPVTAFQVSRGALYSVGYDNNIMVWHLSRFLGIE
ncbi:WD repeat-containing protein 86-like [Haliotis rubra]|uniref:WD repeat-containing protein 86-like n=1 Tax=Haliotis rubra TaxID=36100 RepID=UPI001EE5736E|nr:WD repeat-containing protein 86-like [Haliotis rubra]